MQLTLLVKNSSVTTYEQLVDKLLQLMQQRLMVQHDVARWKWNHNSPIEAPQREQELLAKRWQQAANYNFAPDAAVKFFQQQIHAGKLIQSANFQNWQRKGEGLFADVPSLNHTLRPFLDKLDLELLSTLATLVPILDRLTTQEQELIWSRAQTILQGTGINKTVRQVVLTPLKELGKFDCQTSKDTCTSSLK